MGSGKSTLGKAFADQRQQLFYDSDLEIERISGKTIPEIFQEEGEAGFRKREREVILPLLESECGVLSIGGGAFIQKELRERLLQCAHCIYLQATPETLYERVKESTHRPLLKEGDPLEKLKSLLRDREPYYLQCHQVIQTDGKSVEQLLQSMISLLTHD